MSSSRVFMDYDVQPTIDYFSWWAFMCFVFTLLLNEVLAVNSLCWLTKSFLLCLRLGSNPDIADQVNAEVVTKRETMTIGEIFSYIGQEFRKVNSIYIT